MTNGIRVSTFFVEEMLRTLRRVILGRRRKRERVERPGLLLATLDKPDTRDRLTRLTLRVGRRSRAAIIHGQAGN